MNYLAHLLLAGEHPHHQLGALMADFVRGRPETLAEQYPASVIQGIVGHRKVDVFTDTHPVFQRSRERFSAERRRVSGIIIDVAYDHFLSLHWQRFTHHSRIDFIQSVYDMLSQHIDLMPERMQRVTPQMIEDDWLGSYADLDTIGQVLNRISTRFKRRNPLGDSIEEVRRQLTALEADFLEFFPALQKMATSQAT